MVDGTKPELVLNATIESVRLASPLHVALHELLGVLFEDVIDLVEQLVDVFLDLLALLGELRTTVSAFTALGGLAGPRFLLLLFCHMTLRGTRSCRPAPGTCYPACILADGCTCHAFSTPPELLAERQRLVVVRRA